SLTVQFLDATDTWCEILPFTITPPYDFSADRGSRKPFETFHIRFAPLLTKAIRLSGQPSGSLQVTTISYLAAGQATAAQAKQHLEHLQMPLPQIFQMLPPNTFWDLIASLRDVTGIAFDVQTRAGLGLDHFLDAEHRHHFAAQQQTNMQPASLYRLLGTHEGWAQF